MSILHDASDGKQFVRWALCHNHSRLVGFLRVVDLLKETGQQDSLAVAQSLKMAVTQASTEQLTVPYKDSEWHALNTKLHQDVQDSVCGKTQLLVADAAGDEHKAEDIITGNIQQDVSEQVCVASRRRNFRTRM